MAAIEFERAMGYYYVEDNVETNVSFIHQLEQDTKNR
jgi:hypothetical protein